MWRVSVYEPFMRSIILAASHVSMTFTAIVTQKPRAQGLRAGTGLTGPGRAPARTISL